MNSRQTPVLLLIKIGKHLWAIIKKWYSTMSSILIASRLEAHHSIHTRWETPLWVVTRSNPIHVTHQVWDWAKSRAKSKVKMDIHGISNQPRRLSFLRYVQLNGYVCSHVYKAFYLQSCQSGHSDLLRASLSEPYSLHIQQLPQRFSSLS